MSDDEYYVCTYFGAEEVPYYYGATISPQPLERDVYITAMIAKDDYWSGVMSFKDITEAE